MELGVLVGRFNRLFAVPAAVLRDGEMNMGCTEVMSPWGDAVAAREAARR